MSLAFCPSYNILVCGSRDSGLAIYNLNQILFPSPSSYPSSSSINELSPIIYLNKTHGKQSVTSVALRVENLETNSHTVHHQYQQEYDATDDLIDDITVSDDEKVLMIYTSGRDGCYAKYRLKGITNEYNIINENDTKIGLSLEEVYRAKITKGWLEKVSPLFFFFIRISPLLVSKEIRF